MCLINPLAAELSPQTPLPEARNDPVAGGRLVKPLRLLYGMHDPAAEDRVDDLSRQDFLGGNGEDVA